MAVDYPTTGTVYPQPITETLSRVGRNLSMAVPFRIDFDGSVAKVEGRFNIIRQEMFTLIMTYIGERVMMPLHGSHLGGAVFEVNDVSIVSMLIADIDALIHNQYPAVSIVSLRSDEQSTEENVLSITLDFTIEDEQGSLTFNVNPLLEATQ